MITKQKQSHRYRNKLVDTSGEKEEEKNKIGLGDLEVQVTIYKMDKQEGYIVQHREMQLLFCNNFKWCIIHKNIESACCTPETKSTIL